MLRSVPSIYFILTSLCIGRHSFQPQLNPNARLLFRSRAIVHNFLFSLHKRWQARIYSERNSPCLLCYIKPEMKKKKIGIGVEGEGEKMPKHNTRMVLCSNPGTGFLFLFSSPCFPSSDRMFSEDRILFGERGLPPERDPDPLVAPAACSTRGGAGDPFADYICLGDRGIFSEAAQVEELDFVSARKWVCVCEIVISFSMGWLQQRKRSMVNSKSKLTESEICFWPIIRN